MARNSSILGRTVTYVCTLNRLVKNERVVDTILQQLLIETNVRTNSWYLNTVQRNTGPIKRGPPYRLPRPSKWEGKQPTVDTVRFDRSL